MNERTKGIVQIVFALLVVALSFYFSSNIKQFEPLGYIGIFLISFLSSATIFIPAPGWAAVISLGRVFDPYYVGIIAGIGAGIGEITGYGVGSGATHVLQKTLSTSLIKYKDWIRKYDLFAIAALAFIPNPLFDIAGIAAGSLRIPLWRFLAACIFGRILRYVLLAHLSAFSLGYF